jgi:hypothetical protein
MRWASAASTHSDDISNHAAFCLPINRGNRYDDAASGATPRLVNGVFSRAVDDMNTRSA